MTLRFKDKKSTKNVVADHLSRIEPKPDAKEREPRLMNYAFLDEYIMSIKVMPWYAHIFNYLVAKFFTS